MKCKHCGYEIEKTSVYNWRMTFKAYAERNRPFNAWFFTCASSPENYHQPENKESLFDKLYNRML